MKNKVHSFLIIGLVLFLGALGMSGCTFLQSSNIHSSQLSVSGNVIFMFPMIKVVAGGFDYSACSSDLTVEAEVLTHQTEVASYEWTLKSIDGSGSTSTPLPLQTGCTTGFVNDYTGTGSRSGSSKQFSVIGIQPANDFIIELKVTDIQGRIATARMLVASGERDAALVYASKLTGTVLSNAQPGVSINQNVITFSIQENHNFIRLLTDGDSEFDGLFASFDGQALDVANDNTWSLPYVAPGSDIVQDYVANGDHSASYFIGTQNVSDRAYYPLFATSFIYITQ